MPKPIQNILAARALVDRFDLDGKFSLQLDEVVVPVAVIDRFELSKVDLLSGPPQYQVGAITIVNAGVQPWAAVMPPLQANNPQIIRVRRVACGHSANVTFNGYIIPGDQTTFAGTVQIEVSVPEDFRFDFADPARPSPGIVISSNAASPAPPTNTFQVLARRNLGNTMMEWEPRALIIPSGWMLMVHGTTAGATMNFEFEWDMIDPTNAAPAGS